MRVPDRKTTFKLAFGLAAVVGLALASRWLPLAEWLRVLSARLLELGWIGVVLFCVSYVLAALLLLPGGLLTLTAGAVFGVAGGVAVVSLSATTAASVAYWLARTLLRHRVEAIAARSPRFGAIDRAIGTGGWRVVALLRLSPVVPFSISNYLYGLTRIRFVPYVVTTWITILPVSFALVYLGHIGGESVMATGDASDERSALRWGLLALGAVATIAVSVYLARLARIELARTTSIDLDET